MTLGPSWMGAALASLLFALPGVAGASPEPHAALRAAKSTVRGVEQRATSVQRDLSRARAARDEERAACLDGVLRRLHAEVRVGELHRRTHVARVIGGDAEGAARTLGALRLVGERARELAREATRCGHRDARAHGTTLTVTVDPGIPPVSPEVPGARAPSDPAARF